MSVSFDPRGDLVIPNLPTSRAYRPLDSTRDNRRSLPPNYRLNANQHAKRYHRRPCHDWIFSTASNVHIAIDKSNFKTYTPLKSYVYTMSDQRQVPVKGIGIVEINLRCTPRSNESHTVVLEDVLHVPSWICNIFSDIYFFARPLEYSWTSQGIQFMEKKEGGLKAWGYTTDFFGLEKLSLAGASNGRSPMTEDKDREVFSVNLNWPQGQRDHWQAHGQVAE